MKKKMRIILFILLGLMIVVNVGMVIADKYYDKKFGETNSKDYYVRYVKTSEASEAERNMVLDYAANKELSKHFYFALVDSKNNTMQEHVTTYKITGSKSTIITDSSGKKVYAKFSTWLNEEELKVEAQKLNKK